MKTIVQITNELGIEAIKIYDSSDKNSKYHMEYLCKSELLEALCKAYMADKLSELEPVAEVVSERLADFMLPTATLIWHQPNHEIGAKFYDLSELKGEK